MTGIGSDTKCSISVSTRGIGVPLQHSFPPLSFCSGHNSELGIGSPHGSEKTYPHHPRPCERLEQFDLQLKNVYCLNERSI